ncbi:MAG: hypothetical protein H0X17_10520 [Deltaproteobacteria bacterium]|nr:hypothetical protein [Deltaproteobacteria bacterium]
MFVIYGIGFVVAAFVLAMAFGGWWSRRSEGAGDGPDRRTIATFAGGAPYATEAERAARREAGPYPLGEGILAALAAELRRRGLGTSAIDARDYAVDMRLTLEAQAAVLVLGAIGDHAWTLSVDAQGGGPGPRDLLPHVDAALRSLDGISELKWHRRRAVGATGPEAATADSPLD